MVHSMGWECRNWLQHGGHGVLDKLLLWIRVLETSTSPDGACTTYLSIG
jgi:hypothetical protein